MRGAGHGGLGLGFRRGWPDRGGQRKLLGEEEERILSKGDDGESPKGEEAGSKMGEPRADGGAGWLWRSWTRRW